MFNHYRNSRNKRIIQSIEKLNPSPEAIKDRKKKESIKRGEIVASKIDESVLISRMNGTEPDIFDLSYDDYACLSDYLVSKSRYMAVEYDVERQGTYTMYRGIKLNPVLHMVSVVQG